MESIPALGKELEALRIELVNNGFGVGESKFTNTLYAVKHAGTFRNGLPRMAIEYLVGSGRYLVMGLFYDNLKDVISYLNS